MQNTSCTDLDIEKVTCFIRENYIEEESKSKKAYHIDNLSSLMVAENVYCSRCRKESRSYFSNEDVEAFIGESKTSLNFQNTLQQLIADRNLKNSVIYTKAGIDRKFFSKIISVKNYVPKKEVVMALGIALELPFDAFEEFLATAGYAFMRSSYFDLIIEFCIKNEKFDFYYINSLLSHFGQKCFFS